ncbi:MAG: ankyrin repeat domain-containing protein [Pseudomonadota bacterium]
MSDYIKYFSSSDVADPLLFNLNYLSTYKYGIQEIRWRDALIDGAEVYVAEFRVDGHYRAFVRQHYFIGWRGGYFKDAYIERDFNSYNLNASNLEKFFSENKISSFGVPGAPAFPQRIFSSGNQVYVTTILNNLNSGRYGVIRLSSSNTNNLVCELSVRPTSYDIEQTMAGMPAYYSLSKTLNIMMGGAGNCGTLNSHSSASHALNDSLNNVTYRPWPTAAIVSSVDLESWAYSGVWNYNVYRRFLSQLNSGVRELAELYEKNFKMLPPLASDLANDAIEGAIYAGFSHGRVSDNYSRLHRSILTGVDTEEIISQFAGEINQIISNEKADGDSDSILTYAIGRSDLMAKFLDMGADPNHGNAFGKTPLMYAVQFNDVDAIELLISRGAFVDAVTTKPWDTCQYTITTHHQTALHYAVRYGSEEIIELLVRAGATVLARDSNGKTPMDYLESSGGHVGSEQLSSPEDASNAGEILGRASERLKNILRSSVDALASDVDAANRLAESLYQSGKINEAYAAAKKALTISNGNERALANMSLIALRLGFYGESAKSANHLIGNGVSNKERAAAYYNLGLACEKHARESGYHYHTITYDGVDYCKERTGAYLGPLYYYLASHSLAPTARRAQAIVDFFGMDEVDPTKWACRSTQTDAALQSIYIAHDYVYLLVQHGAKISIDDFIRRDSQSDSELSVTETERFDLDNGYDVIKWKVHVPYQGVVLIGNKICGRRLPLLLDSEAVLVEVYTRARGNVSVTAEMDTETILLLYGNNVVWTVSDNSKNVRAIYMHGKDVSVGETITSGVAVYGGEGKSAYPDPRGSSFNRHTKMYVGLPITAMIEATGNDDVHLDEGKISGLPVCERHGSTSCRF